MDPEVTLALFADAVDGYWTEKNTTARDSELSQWADEAREAASDLCDWLHNGGFVPEHYIAQTTHVVESGGFIEEVRSLNHALPSDWRDRLGRR